MMNNEVIKTEDEKVVDIRLYFDTTVTGKIRVTGTQYQKLRINVLVLAHTATEAKTIAEAKVKEWWYKDSSDVLEDLVARPLKSPILAIIS